MRLIMPSSRRTLYAEKLSDDEFILSVFPETTRHNWRPMERYSSEAELMEEVLKRDCTVIWQDAGN